MSDGDHASCSVVPGEGEGELGQSRVRLLRGRGGGFAGAFGFYQALGGEDGLADFFGDVFVVEEELFGVFAALVRQDRSACSQLVLRNLQQLAAFHGRLVGHDSGDGQVQRQCDVHERLAVLQDRRDELVHQIAM